ncbi:uncharacterized protein LOC142353397 [Convolutriloba macropyga]|uniref:uncharacterized protein LOC142353397 n=1 Tax=Convolutriloba macropyga TaxID=536237 RepID=UPI003F5260A0
MTILSLKKEDFDSRGDIDFPNSQGDKQLRGKLDYFQPDSDWIRVGLRCWDRYDNGNNDWVLMNDNDNEWAVGFHGSTQEGTKAITQSRLLKAGGGQAFQSATDTNKLSDKAGMPCGVGVYFAAFIEISKSYSRFSPGESPCVLQVRIKPDKTRIPEGANNYRIVNDPQFIRPYGLCLKVRNNNRANSNINSNDITHRQQTVVQPQPSNKKSSTCVIS